MRRLGLDGGTQPSGLSSALGPPSVYLPALALLVLTLLLGAAFALSQPSRWAASASFAVLPQAGDAETEAGYYETLSRGQIVSTIAEVISAQQQGLPDDVEVDVEVLPETSLVRLSTTAPSATAAVQVTEQQLEAGVDAVGSLDIPFEPRVVNQPEQTVVEVGADRVKNLAVVAVAALGLALLLQQALLQLHRARQQRARARSRAAAAGT